MSYIPPYKRQSKDPDRPSPIPESLPPEFRRNLDSSSSKSNQGRSFKIGYAGRLVYLWFAVGLDDNSQFPSSVHLEPVPMELIERKYWGRPLALANRNPVESAQVGGNCMRKPWESFAENVLPNLLSSFENVRNEMVCQKLESVKPTLIARFGKIHFLSLSISQETTAMDLAAETTLRKLRRSFYTIVPNSFVENIMGEVGRKIKFDFEEEKDLYHVKLSDATQPDSTLSCKCSVIKEHKKLHLCKVELNPVRHMVVDASCLDKSLDLRLVLYTMGVLTTLTDEEMESIRNLINSAVLDPDVKGGLRWPLGYASSGNRFSVVEVWHTIAKVYKSPSMRLKVRHADRFDFRTSTGEASRDISLKVKNIVSLLQEEIVEISSVSEMLKDTLRLIWDLML
ncbi:uncharacterized protein LOC133851046 isoform X1 [Alnus glutinosa]|uniref:uncharacterized protein LOC133851046 isoform X1 n=1 Tax=Alnus glutinosa TaxID=3517 RepID=UPI002D775ABE|nr:uncharacterized protein LOC133851046 isoform X1 [Alnus glutinosa]